MLAQIGELAWWQWLLIVAWPVVVGTFLKIYPLLVGSRERFERGLQDTIDNLRKRLTEAEERERQCIDERAAYRQELEDLKARNGPHGGGCTQ